MLHIILLYVCLVLRAAAGTSQQYQIALDALNFDDVENNIRLLLNSSNSSWPSDYGHYGLKNNTTKEEIGIILAIFRLCLNFEVFKCPEITF